MKPGINFITLAVQNLQQAKSFYSNVFSFSVAEETGELCMFELRENFLLVLQERTDFLQQTNYNQATTKSAGFMLSQYAVSKDAVEAMIKKAETHGATRVKTLEEAWGYSVSFKDADEHHWEIVFTHDNAAATEQV